MLNFLRPFLRNKAELLPYLKPAPESTNRRLPPTTKPRPLPIRSPISEPPRGAVMVGLEPRGSLVCDCCSQSHALKQCRQFHQEWSNQERRLLIEQKQLCLICFANDHLEPDCLVRRLCTLCRRRHSTWVHTLEDDEAEATAVYAAAEPEQDYEWMYEPGLTGECIGEGFVAYEETEGDEEMRLHYALCRRQRHPDGRRRSNPPFPGHCRAAAQDYRALEAGRQASPLTTPELTRLESSASQRPEFAAETSRPGPCHQRAASASWDWTRQWESSPRDDWRHGTTTRADGPRPPPADSPPFPSDAFLLRPSKGTFRPYPTTGANRGSRPDQSGGRPANPTRNRGDQRSRSGKRPNPPARAGPVPQNAPERTGSQPLAARLRAPGAGRNEHIARTPADKVGVGLQQTLLNVQNPKTKEHMTVNALVDSGANHSAISGRLSPGPGDLTV